MVSPSSEGSDLRESPSLFSLGCKPVWNHGESRAGQDGSMLYRGWRDIRIFLVDHHTQCTLGQLMMQMRTGFPHLIRSHLKTRAYALRLVASCIICQGDGFLGLRFLSVKTVVLYFIC